MSMNPLRKWRQENKLTQVQLQKMTGIPQARISAYEGGVTPVRKSLRALHAVGVDIAALVMWEPPTEAQKCATEEL